MDVWILLANGACGVVLFCIRRGVAAVHAARHSLTYGHAAPAYLEATGPGTARANLHRGPRCQPEGAETSASFGAFTESLNTDCAACWEMR